MLHSSSSRQWTQRLTLTVGLVATLLLAWLAIDAAPPATSQAELPDACLSPNPFFATSRYVRGEIFDDEPAVVAFHDSPDDSGQFVLASIGEVGATYGMAYDPAKDVLYAASYHKRNSKYGPMGPGGIYEVNVNGGGVRPFLTVPNAGTNAHDPEDNYQPDDRSRRYVGNTSLGDIDMSEDGSQLFVMNLNDGYIYRFSLPDGQQLGRFRNAGADEFWGRDAQPFALAVHDGWLFHGVIDSAKRRQSLTNLSAYVYASHFDGSGMRRVAQVWLGWDRDVHERPNWNPWPEDDDQGWRMSRYPHPMLTDIEFDDAGHMILGLRDRYMDNGPSLTEVYRITPGDILWLEKTGDLKWEFDADPGERYSEDNLPPYHEEIAIGGLARIAVRDVVVTTVLDPFRTIERGNRSAGAVSAGAAWFENPSGDDLGREELVYNTERHSGPQGKAVGLGDLELICYIPPTPTPTPLTTPTPTATGLHTATPTRTATVTATPTPSEYRIYLPQSERNPFCIPDAFHSDVVLVLDRSTSMLRSVEEGGLPKNEAAIQAAMAFVDILDLTPDRFGRHDQVAVVGFNDTAWIESDLTFDRAEAIAALERIRSKTIEGTRLDLAILAGQQPLDGPNRKPENRPVIILLTDGLPNRVPTPDPYGRQEETVLAATDQVKLKGSRIYTIGLGKPTDIMPRLLIAMASESWMYYYAPRPEDLAGIYAQIAQTFEECDPAPFPTPDHCVPEEIHADVVLVLDMSTSMTRLTRANRTKFEAALEAAHLFVDLLDLDSDGWGRLDQVGVAGFNAEAWTAIGLSSDRPAIHLALDRLPERQKEGTRLDLALLQGQAILAGPGRIGENRPVMILLTDGLPNRVPTPAPSGHQEDTVLAAAQAAKDAGTFIYTVGLGRPDDIMAWLLEDAASDPSMFFYAPDGEDLADIYRQIAGRISECP